MHLSEFGISLNETLNHQLPGTTTTGQTIRSDAQVENDTAPVMRGGFLIKAHIQVRDFRATAWAQMRKKRQISVFEGKIEKQRELAETDRERGEESSGDHKQDSVMWKWKKLLANTFTVSLLRR